MSRLLFLPASSARFTLVSKRPRPASASRGVLTNNVTSRKPLACILHAHMFTITPLLSRLWTSLLVTVFTITASLGPINASCASTSTLPSTPESDVSYQKVVETRKLVRSSLPSSQQSKAMLELYRQFFTEDAFDGMIKLQEYADYLEDLEREGVEQRPDCALCESNRIILEKTWQVVANEFYDPYSEFSQSKWATCLLDTLKESGGALRSKKELYAAAHQMVARLGDPYSEFLAPSQFRRALRRPLPAERNYLAAQYVGVGVQLGEVLPQGGRLVEAPLAGSPAEAAGIVHGDRLLDVDGVSVDKLTLEQAMGLLRGPEGSPASMALAHSPPNSPPFRVELERRRLPQPPVKSALVRTPTGGEVGYIRLFYFSHETTRALEAALRGGEIRGTDGYILDLRNNPGGTFEEAVAMAALLLTPGQVAIQTVRNQDIIDTTFQVGALPEEVFGARRTAPLTRQPIVVLTNASSASASEVLSMALKDSGRAVVIGEQTFGKGVLQYYFPMSDGSGLKLTVAKYLGPTGYDISHQGGIHPDWTCHDYPRGVLDQLQSPPDTCVQQAIDLIDAASEDAAIQQLAIRPLQMTQ